MFSMCATSVRVLSYSCPFCGQGVTVIDSMTVTTSQSIVLWTRPAGEAVPTEVTYISYSMTTTVLHGPLSELLADLLFGFGAGDFPAPVDEEEEEPLGDLAGLAYLLSEEGAATRGNPLPPVPAHN